MAASTPPNLPAPAAAMSWRDLEAAAAAGEPAHYLACLRYARQLWEEGLPARSLLALDRALFCDVPPGDPARVAHPLPYATVGWMVAQDVGGAFFGNPRVHYQHLADRVRGPRAARVGWRSWAAWSVVRAVRPEWPGDPRHAVEEPTAAAIEAGLRALGGEAEVAPWRAALSGSR